MSDEDLSELPDAADTLAVRASPAGPAALLAAGQAARSVQVPLAPDPLLAMESALSQVPASVAAPLLPTAACAWLLPLLR